MHFRISKIQVLALTQSFAEYVRGWGGGGYEDLRYQDMKINLVQKSRQKDVVI